MEKTNEFIGEGHYGEVYSTMDPAYVVKIIKWDGPFDDEKRIKSAEAEIEIHQSLQHVSHSPELQRYVAELTVAG